MAITVKQFLENIAEATSFDKKDMAARRKSRRQDRRTNKKMRKMVDAMADRDAEAEFKNRGRDFLAKHGGVKEDVADKQFIQNKKHHGNTQLELEGAPSKIGHRKYVGPVKKVPGTVKEANLSGKQVYSSMLSPNSDVAKRTGGIKGSAMTKDKKRLMGMSALRVKGAQIRTEDSDVNEGSWEDFKKRTFTKQGRVHAAAAEILKSKRSRPTAKKKDGVKEDHSLKPTPKQAMARITKKTNRPDTGKFAEVKLTAIGKVHRNFAGKLTKGPHPLAPK